MNRVVLTFVAATLIVVAAVYVLITTTTPLRPMQAIGSGVAFLLGWMGLAYAGSDAIRGMIQRRRARLASGERAPERAEVVARRFWQGRLATAAPRSPERPAAESRKPASTPEPHH